MKTIYLIFALMLASLALQAQVSTRVIGDTTPTNSVVFTNVKGVKAYAFCGYSASTQYIMVFQTNAIPTAGTKATFSFPVSAGQFYSADFSYYGADLDAITVCNSTSPYYFTNGAADTTFQAILRR